MGGSWISQGSRCNWSRQAHLRCLGVAGHGCFAIQAGPVWRCFFAWTISCINVVVIFADAACLSTEICVTFLIRIDNALGFICHSSGPGWLCKGAAGAREVAILSILCHRPRWHTGCHDLDEELRAYCCVRCVAGRCITVLPRCVCARWANFAQLLRKVLP